MQFDAAVEISSQVIKFFPEDIEVLAIRAEARLLADQYMLDFEDIAENYMLAFEDIETVLRIQPDASLERALWAIFIRLA